MRDSADASGTSIVQVTDNSANLAVYSASTPIIANWYATASRSSSTWEGSFSHTSSFKLTHYRVVGSAAGGGYGPACPRVKGAARPCGTGLRSALDPRVPPALGRNCAQGDGPALQHAPAASCARRAAPHEGYGSSKSPISSAGLR